MRPQTREGLLREFIVSNRSAGVLLPAIIQVVCELLLAYCLQKVFVSDHYCSLRTVLFPSILVCEGSTAMSVCAGGQEGRTARRL